MFDLIARLHCRMRHFQERLLINGVLAVCSEIIGLKKLLGQRGAESSISAQANAPLDVGLRQFWQKRGQGARR